MQFAIAGISLQSGPGAVVGIDQGEVGVAFVLLGFVGSFGFIRMSTRIMRSPRISWWPGSVTSGDVHLHHLVFGIFAMIAAGTLGFSVQDASPWFEIAALMFGIGIGLTIDEFALWLYLDDVYWSPEGRKSVDATVIAAAAMGFIVLGVQPFDFSSGSPIEIIASVIGLLLQVSLVTICFVKGRMMHGTVGFFVPPVAIYAALRLGKPGSVWARRRYAERDPDKQARARQRFLPDRRTERFKNTFRDAVGGSTADVYEEKLAERETTQEAVDEIRERAERQAN